MADTLRTPLPLPSAYGLRWDDTRRVTERDVPLTTKDVFAECEWAAERERSALSRNRGAEADEWSNRLAYWSDVLEAMTINLSPATGFDLCIANPTL